MTRYDFAAVEARWQDFWRRNKTFRSPGPGDPGFDPARPKFYILDMFPYPSAAGLHVGHPKGYVATDVLARFYRLRGYNVLHPMGWDAFGLPAEQYALQTGTHPAQTTAANVAAFRRQLQALGFSYDWDREINTTDPGYYRWTQWIFARLYERGLAYQAEVAVWWCPALGTVLANEEVIDGKSERGGFPCERRPLRQWMLKITAYAERLLADLDGLDWPESVKTMQREWIGRSEGAEIQFQVCGAPDAPARSFTVFTTRPDTLFGATFCVLAPEHPLVPAITTPARRPAVERYREQAAQKGDLERTALAKDKTGEFTGAYAVNPVYPPDDPRAAIPIYVADYVLMSYGSGAIMAVPGGDRRDFEFARRYGLPVVAVVRPEQGEIPECHDGPGIYVHSGFLDGLHTDVGRACMCAWLERHGHGRFKVTYRLRDWLFSRQRYWGEPFPILHGRDGAIRLVADEDLPVMLPELADFQPSPDGQPPLARATTWLQVRDRDGTTWTRETNSMPQWAGSCWYYLRFCDPHNTERPWDPARERYWMPVDFYVGGAEHAVLHLLYARFWHKVLFDAGLVSTPEPFRKLVNQGMVQAFAYRDGRGALVPSDQVAEAADGQFRHQASGEPLARFVGKMSKSLRNVVNPDDVIREYGADTMRLYEAFMGPVTASAPWNPRDLPGVHRFLQRAWRLYFGEDGPAAFAAAADPEVERALHKTIAKVEADIPRLDLNTAIAALMEWVNVATRKGGTITRAQGERFALLLAPFAPHFAEELWRSLGHAASLADERWPAHDPSLLVVDELELPIQVNGKLRGRVRVAAGADPAAVEAAARAAVADKLDGAAIRKVVVIPGKMVNFVVG